MTPNKQVQFTSLTHITKTVWVLGILSKDRWIYTKILFILIECIFDITTKRMEKLYPSLLKKYSIADLFIGSHPQLRTTALVSLFDDSLLMVKAKSAPRD